MRVDVGQQLLGFFTVAAKDDRLNTSHACVYAALCGIYAASGLQPFSINRRQIMQACKILGNATYHKCMRDLHDFGYISYTPSYHPILGSLVCFSSVH